ncbi:DUF222 domain-containing protein [Microbacterium sp. bgisy189]|uniref:HNH endonuclease signature motif containing protein n=1 Tax=Microbacterium sp. bgisy189 TaxID=3413798 RepID=UPI003EBAFD1D
MSSNGVIGFSDGETAVLAEIVAEIEKTQAILTEVLSRQTRALAAAGDLARKQAAGSSQRVRDHDMALRGIAAEVAGVLRVTDRTVQARIGQALDLVEQFPVTMTAWETGTITQGHVRVITETGSVIPAGEREPFETHAVQRAVEETPGRIRDELRLLAERLHPRTLQERHVDARETRRVCVTPIGDGMSEVTSIVPSALADGIYDRLTQQARAVKDAAKRPTLNVFAVEPGAADAEAPEPVEPDTRTMDQLRADVFADLLLTGAPAADPTRTDDGPGVLGALRGRVQILVPALTLLGDDRAPADLVGHAPIDPATARELATVIEGPWERVITHPVTGAVLHCDTYHRTAAIDRHLRARDRHCRFPGCRQPAVRCEQDHTIDHAHDGPTEVCNLEHLCQRHHSMKQFTAWKVRQHGGGILEWTSPLGRVYIDRPPVLGVHFTPDTSDPPGPRSPDDPPPF